MSSVFQDCTGLKEVSIINTKNITKMNSTFKNCQYLEEVGIMDLTNVTTLSEAFSSCARLTDTALNNILASLANGTSVSTKTLSSIGITSTQATRCTSLSNWAAAQAAGWTTGY